MEARTNLPLRRLSKAKIPFVKGSFKTKEGKTFHGYFLIDTGSQQNILNYEAKPFLDEAWMLPEKRIIQAFGNMEEMCEMAAVEVQVGGEDAQETFCLSRNIDFASMFKNQSVLGILGSSYLLKHHLVLDFEQKTLHNLEIEEVELDAITFLYSMNDGFETYGCPIVKMVKNEKEFLILLDSGCELSCLTQAALEHGALEANLNLGDHRARGFCGSFNTKLADLKCNLLCLTGNDLETKEVTIEERFQIFEGSHSICTEAPNVMPISGLLSTDFMIRHGWILDFNYGAIYSRTA